MRHTRVFAVASIATMLTLAPRAQAQGAVAGVDVMSATIFQEGQSSFSGIGLRLRLRSQELIPAVQIMPTLEYWRNSSKVQPFGIRTVRTDATLGVDARYAFSTANWKPYVGAGFGLHFLSNEVDAPTLGLVDANSSVVKGGLSALGGTTFEITERLGNFIEGKYHHVGGYKQLKINWGLTYAF